MFNYRNVQVAASGVGPGIHMLNLLILDYNGQIQFGINNITNQDILTLFHNYELFLYNCPVYALQTNQQAQHGFFQNVNGAMIPHAQNYFNLLRNILQQRLTNALLGNVVGAIIAQRDFLVTLHDHLSNRYGHNVPNNTDVVPQANPRALLDFLQQGINAANQRLNVNQHLPALGLENPGLIKINRR